MKSKLVVLAAMTMLASFMSCKRQESPSETKIIFLHHSTGAVLWNGSGYTTLQKITGKISKKLITAQLPAIINEHNKKNGKNYHIEERIFPKAEPYGWHNYPYDYYNIWVKNAGEKAFMEEPTLEILTKDYDVIIFKHCFPVSNIQPEQDSADINSNVQTISNYKLQYAALKNKLQGFPDTKFILFTGAALIQHFSTAEEARRAKDFFDWVREDWDQPQDNIFIWDLYCLQTEDQPYFKEEYAVSSTDSHPNQDFAGKIVKLLANRIVDVIENDGQNTQLTGENK